MAQSKPSNFRLSGKEFRFFIIFLIAAIGAAYLYYYIVNVNSSGAYTLLRDVPSTRVFNLNNWSACTQQVMKDSPAVTYRGTYSDTRVYDVARGSNYNLQVGAIFEFMLGKDMNSNSSVLMYDMYGNTYHYCGNLYKDGIVTYGDNKIIINSNKGYYSGKPGRFSAEITYSGLPAKLDGPGVPVSNQTLTVTYALMKAFDSNGTLKFSVGQPNPTLPGAQTNGDRVFLFANNVPTDSL